MNRLRENLEEVRTPGWSLTWKGQEGDDIAP
jgi:hypothetical protein